MTVSHRQRRVDRAMRVAGVLLCGLAGLAIARLAALPLRPHAVSATAYLLATLGFLGASAGSAMAVLGGHLFDEIEVSQRWRHRRPARRSVAPVGIRVAPDADGLGAGGAARLLGAHGHA